MALTGGSALRTPLLGGEFTSVQPYTITTLKQPSESNMISPAARSAIQKAIAYYQKGGGFGQGVEAALERGRKKSLSSGMQALINAGLGGTSMTAGLGKKYEEEIAMPMRERVEEERGRALSDIYTSYANTLQNALQSFYDRQMQTQMATMQTQIPRAMTQRSVPQSLVQQPAQRPTSTGGLMEAIKTYDKPMSLVGNTSYIPQMGWTQAELKKYENPDWYKGLATTF